MTIDNLRKKIDNLDIDITNLLKARAEAAVEIGRLKGESDSAVLAPHREHQVLDNVLKIPHSPIPDEALTAIYRDIISACRNLEKTPRVAYLGPKYTFSHQVAVSQFGVTAEYVMTENISAAITELKHNRVDFAILPAENSTEGVVRETFDALYNSNQNIIAEVLYPIRHSLYSKGKLTDITQVVSHPQAMAQSREWLRKNLPNVVELSLNSTAQGAELAKDNNTIAAICTDLAAKECGLELIADRIESNENNCTRFFIVGSIESKISGKDKTSMLFTVKHKTGALNEILNIFANHGINIAMIESRPDKNINWEYIFYLDIEGHKNDEKVKQTLAEVEKSVQFLRIFGSYPIA